MNNSIKKPSLLTFLLHLIRGTHPAPIQQQTTQQQRIIHEMF